MSNANGTETPLRLPTPRRQTRTGSPPNSDDLTGPPRGPDGTAREFHFEAAAQVRLSEGLTPVGGWTGWRRRLLIAFVVLGAVGMALWLRVIVLTPHLPASWRATANGQLELIRSDDPALRPFEDAVLVGVRGKESAFIPLDAKVLRRSSRWVISDWVRAQQRTMQSSLAAALRQPAPMSLEFSGGSRVDVAAVPRGLAGLSPTFWLLCAFAAALYLVAGIVLIGNPVARNRLYALAAWCQTGNLLMIATETTLELGVAEPFAAVGMSLHMAFDLATAAAIVVAAGLHPRRLRGTAAIAILVAGVAIALPGLDLAGLLPNAWWWTQICVTLFGVGVIGLLSWSYRIEPNPFALVLRRFGVLTLSTWTLLTVALATADRLPGLPHNVADIASMVWYVFLGSQLLLVPFLAQAHHALREFSLLAGICTVATSLDLLFVSLFTLSPFASLTLSVFISLVVYSVARQSILDQLLGNSKASSERMFEQLYRIAREVQAQPDRAPTLLARLVGDLFEPLEVNVVEPHFSRSRVASDGSSMLVPLPVLGAETAPRGSVLMRFAHRGRRLFSAEDARLSDQVVEQLRRAVDFDRAVEQGRSEERLRIAQDLHDDIGARLLTLMYKAASTEMEEYARHTLQDLKTLTRGLAASNHRLSHASAEWKSDLAHRLTAAHVELVWSFVFDEDIPLTVVHWSALTRVLRELVSNAIAHAKAQRLTIDFRLENDSVEMTVVDDGIGTDPGSWSHGLGLGGVRKRVKQLGGQVEWREAEPHGISCRVVIPGLSTKA